MSTGQGLTPVLQHAQSADATLRKQAELQLQAYQQQDYAGYLVALVSELANDAKPPETRQIAGLLLKNLLDATDAVLKVGSPARFQQAPSTPDHSAIASLPVDKTLFVGGHAQQVVQRGQHGQDKDQAEPFACFRGSGTQTFMAAVACLRNPCCSASDML